MSVCVAACRLEGAVNQPRLRSQQMVTALSEVFAAISQGVSFILSNAKEHDRVEWMGVSNT